MPSHSRVVLGSAVGLGVLTIFIFGFHLGGEGLLKVGIYSPLLCALIGGIIILVCVNRPLRQEEDVEPWLERERLDRVGHWGELLALL